MLKPPGIFSFAGGGGRGSRKDEEKSKLRNGGIGG